MSTGAAPAASPRDVAAATAAGLRRTPSAADGRPAAPFTLRPAGPGGPSGLLARGSAGRGAPAGPGRVSCAACRGDGPAGHGTRLCASHAPAADRAFADLVDLLDEEPDAPRGAGTRALTDITKTRAHRAGAPLTGHVAHPAGHAAHPAGHADRIAAPPAARGAAGHDLRRRNHDKGGA
ncbi:hypothetical protein ABZ951_18680 [Streptomyces sp. NPDC046215]|uniref:hypothetical protein n=1 Tax=Streptomyces sp. NPDC046215 TaxID=3155774 RepID=UPI0033EFB062